jgi:hypothetical protein
MAAPTISRNLRMRSDVHPRVKLHDEERSAPCRGGLTMDNVERYFIVSAATICFVLIGLGFLSFD